MGDEFLEETVWFYCDSCDEEYELPEDSSQCPFCWERSLEAL